MNATTPPEPQVKMTLRVYRVTRDGTVTADRGTISILAEEGPVPIGGGYPPCRCARCRTGRAVSA